MDIDLVIIGGGPAGLAAAIKAYDSGVKNLVIIERDSAAGGILQQCIHNGFGLTRFKENITGPEYAQRFIDGVAARGIKIITQTTVLNVTSGKRVDAISATHGLFSVQAKAVILAMGCRERSKGALNIAGTRPSGLFSAGTAQKYVNINGWLPGKRVVILGSGDIGLIMARRMTLEGAKVLAVCEIMPHSSGLRRNIAQCLDDFNIPLYLSHTITKIEGQQRVTGVTVAKVDANKRPIEGTQLHFDCDTVLFSVGLIPENELSIKANVILSNQTKGAVVDEKRQTSVSGIFACGNVLHVHDLVDFVSEEAEIAGKAAAQYLLNGSEEENYISTKAGNKVSYVLPQRITIKSSEENSENSLKLYFRVKEKADDVYVVIKSGGRELLRKKKIAVAPGEMETVLLSSKILSGVSESLIISIE